MPTHMPTCALTHMQVCAQMRCMDECRWEIDQSRKGLHTSNVNYIFSTVALHFLALSFFITAHITRSMNSQRVSRLAPKHRPIVPPTLPEKSKAIKHMHDLTCMQLHKETNKNRIECRHSSKAIKVTD